MYKRIEYQVIKSRMEELLSPFSTFLHAPYPLIYHRWQAALYSMLIVFLVLSLLQPFGIAYYSGDKLWMLVGNALVTGLMLCIPMYVMPALFPRYHDDRRWTVGKQLLSTIEICLFITLGLWVYLHLLLNLTVSLFTCLVMVTLLTPLPVIFLLMWNRTLLLKRTLRELEGMNAALVQRSISEEVVTAMPICFEGTTKEVLTLDAAELLYVESEGNYVNIVYKQGDRTQHKLIRMTLKQAGGALQQVPFVVRCHRAFLVNLNAVTKVTGNLQGYQLQLGGAEQEVPVSRGYAKDVKDKLML